MEVIAILFQEILSHVVLGMLLYWAIQTSKTGCPLKERGCHIDFLSELVGRTNANHSDVLLSEFFGVVVCEHGWGHCDIVS
jgi:hypothetical protein